MPDTSGIVEGVMAQSLSLALLNAVTQQQLDGIVATAVTTMAAAAILGASHPAQAGGTQAPAAPAEVLKAAAASEAAAGGAQAGDAVGMAYQFVAQSVALAVQNAASQLRNISTLSTVAMGVAMARMLATPADASAAAAVIQVAQDALAKGTEGLQQVWKESAAFLEQLAKASGSGARTSSTSQTPPAGWYQAASEALSAAVQNAVSAQQQNNVSSQAATVMGVAMLYEIDTAASGR